MELEGATGGHRYGLVGTQSYDTSSTLLLGMPEGGGALPQADRAAEKRSQIARLMLEVKALEVAAVIPSAASTVSLTV